MLRLQLEKKVCSEQTKQKHKHDELSKDHSFNKGDTVWMRDFRGSNKLISGVIVESVGPVSYKIQLQDGQVCKRHINHIHSQKRTSVSLSQDSEHTDDSHWLTYPVQPSSTSNTNLPPVAP